MARKNKNVNPNSNDNKPKEKIDYLNREECIEKICNIVLNLSSKKANTSFAINGEWGCGKTFILDKIEERLEADNKNQFAIFHYNCWKQDYYEEPLVAIVSMMINEIEKDETVGKEALYYLKIAGSLLYSAFNKVVENKTGINIDKIADIVSSIDDGKEQKKKLIDSFDPYRPLNEALDLLTKAIEKIASEKTIVFVVDELDRCLPQYAIKVLERLHHITEDIDNFITIIAIDKNRLLQSVADAFGYDKNKESKESKNYRDSEKYLEKFIKHFIPLDAGICSLDIAEKYKTYLKMFDESLFCCKIKFEEYFGDLFYTIDMREQEQLMEKAELAHCMVADPSKSYDYTVMYMELLLLVIAYFYKSGIEGLHKEIKIPANTELKVFCSSFLKAEYSRGINFNRKEEKYIKNNFYSILEWYTIFLNHCDHRGIILENVDYVNEFARETNAVKEINMEENLKFLYHFYQELINL
ncbi:MAG: KAP family NTPase [Clostridia bacterium]|nr:KAP family NTPase [Clostridia bacterium]